MQHGWQTWLFIWMKDWTSEIGLHVCWLKQFLRDCLWLYINSWWFISSNSKWTCQYKQDRKYEVLAGDMWIMSMRHYRLSSSSSVPNLFIVCPSQLQRTTIYWLAAFLASPPGWNKRHFNHLIIALIIFSDIFAWLGIVPSWSGMFCEARKRLAQKDSTRPCECEVRCTIRNDYLLPEHNPWLQAPCLPRPCQPHSSHCQQQSLQ